MAFRPYRVFFPGKALNPCCIFLFYFLEKRKDEDYDEDLEEDLLDEVCVDSDILFELT